MRTTHKRFIGGLAATALLALPLTACGSEDETDAPVNGGSSAAAEAPEPVASIDALTGESTAIALDKGFTDALTTLKLTPGVTGDAKLEAGSLIFPITGGNVSVFEPGSVPNYVVGQIQHENSGLSLTAGDTKVELTNFNVDPGVSRVYGDVTVNGKTAVTNAFLFNLNGSTLEPLKTEGSNAILTGTQVEISDVAAPLLNDTFKTDAVKPGLLVGIATITVATS
ncbi:hypothetical protein [Nocardioides lijunqiniae]|uniref:hypothetical protein n=1 Tax=Nocardioides lijunqiniae TaxID=2760832 RepID=UPI001878FA31|nr:hypothetical protein [Nocardioides lijunqiniae]